MQFGYTSKKDLSQLWYAEMGQIFRTWLKYVVTFLDKPQNLWLNSDWQAHS